MTGALPSDEQPDDEALMVALANGNLSPLGALYDRHVHHVRHFVLRATGDPSVVDDMTQDAFLGLANSAPHYEPRGSVRTFLVGIAAKLILRQRRRFAVRARLLTENRLALEPTSACSPEVRMQANEYVDRYRVALSKLTEAKRITFLLVEFEGMPGADVAILLDIPIGTVWTRLHNARAELLAMVFSADESELPR